MNARAQTWEYVAEIIAIAFCTFIRKKYNIMLCTEQEHGPMKSFTPIDADTVTALISEFAQTVKYGELHKK